MEELDWRARAAAVDALAASATGAGRFLGRYIYRKKNIQVTNFRSLIVNFIAILFVDTCTSQ